MRPIRFSVSAFMGAIVAIAALLAMLRFPSPLLANALFSIVVLALSLSLIGVLFTRRLDRARWAGALVAGGITFALHFVPWLEQRFGDFLVTAAFADILFDQIAAPPPHGDEADSTTSSPARAPEHAPVIRFGRLSGGFGKGFGPGPPPPSPIEVWTRVDREQGPRGFPGAYRAVGRVRIMNPAPDSIQRIVDCLAVLLSAIIGAVFARRSAARSAPPADPRPMA